MAAGPGAPGVICTVIAADVVQNAPMIASWPRPSERVRELIRRGAEGMLREPETVMTELHEVTFASFGEPIQSLDPALHEAVRLSTEATIRHWLTANVQAPGERVAPFLGEETLGVARDMTRRGLGDRGLDLYRATQAVALRQWMDVCFAMTDDVAVLQELLGVLSRSISTFLDDTIAAITRSIDLERDELTGGTHAQRLAMATMLIEGAPVRTQQAERQLGYRLAGDHVAALLWISSTRDSEGPAAAAGGQLEEAAEALMRAAGCRSRLTLVASATSVWLWLPTAVVPGERELLDRLTAVPDVLVAVGRAAAGPEGFRRSHLDATAAQRMQARLGSRRRVVRYEDVHLAVLLSADTALAEEFVRDHLGALAEAGPELIETVSTYIREQFNAARTAERLFTHRNTVLRRLERADALLPRPLRENVTNVAAALELSRVR
jgi:DNA-binding PucR family transcriptional regulator